MKLRTVVAAVLGSAHWLWVPGVALAQTQAPVAADSVVEDREASEAADAATARTPNCLIPTGYMLVPIPDSAAARAQIDTVELGPVELPYQEGDPVPRGYHLVEQQRRGLLIAGAIVTGVPWAFGITAATAGDFDDGTALLLIPVLGPWLSLTSEIAQDRCAVGSESCTNRASVRGILVFDGLVQTAGATMLAFGLLVPRIRMLRQDGPISFLPTTLGRGGYGLTASGSF